LLCQSGASRFFLQGLDPFLVVQVSPGDGR
jgi:hypothetical protein